MDKNRKELLKKLYTLSVIKNSVALICFTVLAIVFNRWWIVFFSLIFMVVVEHDE